MSLPRNTKQEIITCFSDDSINQLMHEIKMYSTSERRQQAEEYSTWLLLRNIDTDLSLDFIRHIQGLLHHHISEILNNITIYLAKRWEFIRSTQYAYQCSHLHPLNAFFIKLANLVANDLSISPLLLLMPTLEIEDYEISGDKLADFPLEPWRFVLSDEDNALIDVEKTLTFSMQFNPQSKKVFFFRLYTEDKNYDSQLSTTEQYRVMYHSQSARQFFIQKSLWLTELHCGKTIGSEVKKLREGLRFGGVHGRSDGSEFNAGHEANEAIYHFNEYIESILSLDEKKLLFTASVQQEHEPENIDIDTITVDENPPEDDLSSESEELSFRYYWKKLARPAKKSYGSTVYCVELIGNEIENILADNPNLFDIIPSRIKNARTQKNIRYLKQISDELENRLKSNLNDQNYRVDHGYSLENSLNTLAERIALMLTSKDTSQHTFDLLCAYIRKHHFLDHLLAHIESELKMTLLKKIAKNASLFLTNTTDLFTLVKIARHHKCWRTLAKKIPNKFFRKLATSPEELFTIMSILPNPRCWQLIRIPSEKMAIVELIRAKPNKLIKSFGAFQKFIQWLPKKYKSTILNQLDLHFLISLLHSIEELKFITPMLARSKQRLLLAQVSTNLLSLLLTEEALIDYIALLQNANCHDLLSLMTFDDSVKITTNMRMATAILPMLPDQIRLRYLQKVNERYSLYSCSFDELVQITLLLPESERLNFIQALDVQQLVQYNRLANIQSIFAEIDKLQDTEPTIYSALLKRVFEYHLPVLQSQIPTSSTKFHFFQQPSRSVKALNMMTSLFTEQKISAKKLTKYQSELSHGDLGEFFKRERAIKRL